ncbi:MAG: SET domain-containing protein [Planctomycetales bacterium]
MLLVHASAGPSPIHGLGLFAREFIAAQTPIWELTPGFDLEMTREFLDSLSPWTGEQIRRFLYIEIETGKYILCSDDAKYMNHADQPNTCTVGRTTIALCEILPGEELTCDYREFDASYGRVR